MDWYYLWLIGYILTTAAICTIFVHFLMRTCLKRDLESLRGKHVLVTGGSSGIGKCMAIEAAKLGADVTIIARDVIKLEAAVDEIEKNCFHSSQKIRSVALDVSNNYEYIEKTLHQLEKTYGPVYMLVNCAGMAICGIFEDMTINDIHHLINLNLMGNLHTIKALIGRMKSRKEGHIVVTASQAALIGIYGLSVYSSTKFALRGLAESLYMEVKPFGIAVTLAMPPDTDTPGFENEEKSKPLATSLISQVGGLYSPDSVAEQIMKDTLNKKFFSTVGFDNKLMAILCSGMSPASSCMEILGQSFIMGILRLVSFYYQFSFQRIIKKCLQTN